MKRHFYLILAIFMLTNPFVSINCQAQKETPQELNRTIQLPAMKDTVYDLLQMIAEICGYYLIYDSNIIDNRQIRKIKKGNRTIAQAIYEITEKETLQLSIKDNYILITSPQTSLHTTNHIQGTLIDAESKQPIAFGTVHIQGVSWGTVSNLDGGFHIHIPDSLQHSSLVFSHIGYKPQTIDITSLVGSKPIIHLTPHIIPIPEVIVRIKEPTSLLNGMLQHIEKNYSSQPIYLTTFYREGIKHKEKLLDFTEGMLCIYKPSFLSTQDKDQAKLLNKKRITFRTIKDSLIAKISGGVHTCLTLDAITHLPPFLQPNNGYLYFFSDMTLLNDRSTYVIRFIPKEKSIHHFYTGNIYIDTETLALIQVEFNIHPEHIKKKGHTLIKQQSKHLKLSPEEAKYTLSYQRLGNKYYINHIRGDLHFKVKKKKWLTNSSALHIWFEMATCQIDTNHVKPFITKDCFNPRAIFMDIPLNKNNHHWDRFNIIPREESLKKNIEALKKNFEKKNEER